MISSQPSEQYGFTTLFLFLLFLNSDIGIVILYIVKYIRKAFSLPKKINFEVQNLTNIHVFRFAFSDLYCYHTDLQNARNAVSDNLIFKSYTRLFSPLFFCEIVRCRSLSPMSRHLGLLMRAQLGRVQNACG